MKGTLMCEAIVRTGMVPQGARTAQGASCGSADERVQTSDFSRESDQADRRASPTPYEQRGDEDEELDLDLLAQGSSSRQVKGVWTYRLTQALLVLVWFLVLLVVLGVTSALSQVLAPPPSLPPPLTAWTPCEPTETPL